MDPATPNDQDPTIQEVFCAALGDVIAHPERYADSAQLRLPAKKQDFPKLVLLDTNHWINLWRAHVNGSRVGGEVRGALDALRSAIASGKAIVACTGANIGELSGWNEEKSRIQRVEFLVELSQNHSLVSALTVRAAETAAAVMRLCKNAPHMDDMRAAVLRLGVEYALGFASQSTGNPAADKLLPLVYRHPRMSVHLIAHYIHPTYAKTKLEVAPLVAKAIQVRALDQALPYEKRLRRELEVSYAECAPQLLEPFGVDPAEFHTWLNTGDNRRTFWLSVPGVDVSLNLFLTRDKNINASTEANDVHDVQLLELGLPYANIVLTEKRWRHVAMQARLDSKYDCTVLASLDDLESSLRKHGCL